MQRIQKTIVITLAAGLVFGAGAAKAEPVELAGRLAASALFAVSADSSQGGAQVSMQLQGSYILNDGHNEIGAGYSLFGSFSDNFDLATHTIQATYRYNFGPFGSEGNVVPYAGANVGVAIIKFAGGGFSSSETTGSGGPRVGIEYYFTPDVAVQLDNYLAIQEDTSPMGSGAKVQNTLALGIRLLF